MRIARLVVAALVAAAFAVFTAASPALAHNSLTKAVPDKNATVTKSPAAIELSFLQTVDAKFLTIVVTDAQKQKVPVGAAEADGKKATLPITGELADGAYTVAYRVVSEDGHPVQGSYEFTVDAPQDAAPAPSATVSASPSLSAEPAPAVTSAAPSAPSVVAAADTSDDGSSGALIAVIVAALAVIAIGAFLLVRRRKTP